MANSVTLPSGVRLFWREEGSGGVLLLIHGLGGWNWGKVLPELASKFRVVAPYLRGWGGSRGPLDYAMEELAADVASLLDHLDCGPVNLAGHSLGGMVAQVVVTDHPETVRRLALISTTSHTGRRAHRFALAMASISEAGADAALSDPALRADVEAILAEAFPDAPPPVELLARGFEKPNPAAAAAWRATSEFSRKDRLADISCPVLVAHGTLDILIPYKLGEWIHEAIGHSLLRTFEAGHSIQMSHPQDFSEMLIEFLETPADAPAARPL